MSEAHASLWAASAFLAAVVAVTIPLRGVWPFVNIVSLAPQIAVIGVGFALIMFGRGSAAAALLFALSALVCLIVVRPLFQPKHAPVEPQLKVVWHNLWGRNASLTRAAEIALAENADVLAIAEEPREADLPPAFLEAFSHRHPLERGSDKSPVIFSRTPLLDPTSADGLRRSMVSATIETKTGSYRLIALHAHVAWTPDKLKRQRRDIAAAFDAGSKSPRAIVVGDFNATLWNESVAAQLAAAPALKGVPLGLAATWLAPAPFIGVPIDLVFVSEDLEGAARLGPMTGSDHWPVIVSVRSRDGELAAAPSTAARPVSRPPS